MEYTYVLSLVVYYEEVAAQKTRADRLSRRCTVHLVTIYTAATLDQAVRILYTLNAKIEAHGIQIAIPHGSTNHKQQFYIGLVEKVSRGIKTMKM